MQTAAVPRRNTQVGLLCQYASFKACTFSAALGQGWRLGFLGLLHMDVFCQRLEQEYDANVVITTPSVPYKGLCSVFILEGKLGQL